jgi:hypothetical protein
MKAQSGVLEHSKYRYRLIEHHPAPLALISKEADMKSTFLALTLTALSIVLWPSSSVFAQEKKVARGTVAAIGASSLTLQVRGEPIVFTVDRKTLVDAPGAGTKARQADMLGKSGPQLHEVLKVGQPVAVTYRDSGTSPYASFVRAVPSAGSGGGSVKTSSMHSSGRVKAIASNSITIEGRSGGGASFVQTLMVDADTSVVGRGAGTATAASGGRAPLTELIAAGDKVRVTYRKEGSTLRASNVRVTAKGSKAH